MGRKRHKRLCRSSSMDAYAIDKQKDVALAALDEKIGEMRLVELHTHLMGMGSADFWVSRIMKTYLPRITRHNGDRRLTFRKAEGIITPLIEDTLSRTNHGKGKLAFVELMKAVKGEEHELETYNLALSEDLKEKLKLESNRMEYFLTHFTDDVVFDETSLATQCNITTEQKEMRRYRLETLFNNASTGLSIDSLFKTFIYFDARRGQMVLNEGLRNSDLVAMMPTDNGSGRTVSIVSTVRNWFELLGHNGCAPDPHDIIRMFRGNFTPEFCPMRFRAKDCIYQQRPEVLGILLNTVLARYARAGVMYIEFSIGRTDVMKPHMLRVLMEKTFTKPIFEPDDEMKILSSEESQSYDDDESSFIDGDDDGSCSDSKHITTSKKRAKRRIQKNPVKVPKGLGFIKDCKPKWRLKFGGYNPKPRKQLFAILMAFNRQDVCLGKLKNKKLTFDKKPTKRSSEAYDRLCELSSATDLEWLSEQLCQDKNLERMFPNILRKGGDADKFWEILQAREAPNDLLQYWMHSLVGFDLVGDEMGFPFSPFSHKKFIKIIEWFHGKGKTRFGVRLHAGEGVPRSSDTNSTMYRAFELHLRVVMASIRQLHTKMKKFSRSPPIRIGHGVAFLHEPTDNSKFDLALNDFREFCKNNKVVFELNPTSNHFLLADSHDGNGGASRQALPAFLKKELPVTLCTDDDGIWTIHKCCDHYHHVSVAHEYCQAIMQGEITKENVDKMIETGRDAAFSLKKQ